LTAWRKFLKDLITYFREISSSYEHRAKSLLKVSNVINNTNAPASLLSGNGGLNDANRFLRDFHKQSIVEANKARDIEADVINQLSGLRADLAQKIKEIKSLSGDFKNNVEKEKENTRKCVTALEEALAVVDTDPSAIAGKGDPYVVRLGVERQVERQIDEENYLHRVSRASLRADLHTNGDRPTSTSKTQGASLSQSSLARSRKPTMLLQASSSVKPTRCTPQSRSFAVGLLPCPETKNGVVSSAATLTSSTLICLCAGWKRSSTLESIIQLPRKSEPACSRGRANT
jgi:hypothetical protein